MCVCVLKCVRALPCEHGCVPADGTCVRADMCMRACVGVCVSKPEALTEAIIYLSSSMSDEHDPSYFISVISPRATRQATSGHTGHKYQNANKSPIDSAGYLPGYLGRTIRG